MEYLVTLRLVHILSAVIWTGSMIYFAAFIIPASQHLGSDGNRFISQLIRTNKMPIVMNVAAVLSIVSGMILMRRLLGSFQAGWFSSPHIVLLMIGGLFSMFAFLIGLTVNFKAARGMVAIGKVIESAGGIANEDQLIQLSLFRKRSFCASRIVAILLFLSLGLMSVVKYF